MRFRQDVARADIENESGEHSKVYEKRVRRKGEKQGGKGSCDRSQGVRKKECLRPTFRILMGKHESDGIHSVGKPVGDYRQGYRHSHCRINLESKPDSDSVEKTMSDERGSGKRAYVRMVVVGVVAFVVMVYQDGFL